MFTKLKIKDLQDGARRQRVAIRSQCVPTNTRKACLDSRGKSEIAPPRSGERRQPTAFPRAKSKGRKPQAGGRKLIKPPRGKGKIARF
jgi:hypothetical protein